jgi:hypothetical protein
VGAALADLALVDDQDLVDLAMVSRPSGRDEIRFQMRAALHASMRSCSAASGRAYKRLAPMVSWYARRHRRRLPGARLAAPAVGGPGDARPE